MGILHNAFKNVIVLLFILSNLGKLHACDCTGQSVEQGFNNSSIIFEGEIVSGKTVFRSSSIIVYEIKVLSCFKGNLEHKVMKIYADEQGAACGYIFEIGKQYMIYADFAPPIPDNNGLVGTGNYSVSGCSRTTSAVDYECSNIERFLSNTKEKERMRYFFGNESIFKHISFAVEKSMREEFRKAMRD